jgi:hypothetical protein
VRDRGICKGIKKATFLGVALRPTGLPSFGGLDLLQWCCNYTQLEIQWNCFIEAPHDDGLEST